MNVGIRPLAAIAGLWIAVAPNIQAQGFDTLVACTQDIELDQNHFKLVPDPRFHDELYVFVGDIKDKWKRTPANIVLFITSAKSWGLEGRISENEFNLKVGSAARPSEQWRLKAQKGGESIQFGFGGRLYMLLVARLRTTAIGDRAFLRICQRR